MYVEYLVEWHYFKEKDRIRKSVMALS